ncbi:MAG: FeoA family protein [Oscillospiraceae bacterium]|nr:FeoA family protein [Oscillospiraceae bacterium]
MTLDKLPIGKPAVILTVGGEGDLRCHLLDMGIIPHTEVTVRKVAPLGDPIEIFLRGYTMTLRKDDAAKIEVRPKEEI